MGVLLNKIHIAFCTDENYAAYTGVAMTSIILNNPQTSLVFHLFHIGINKKDESKFMLLQNIYSNVEITVYNLSDKFEIDSYKINHYYTKAVYLRWYIAESVDKHIKRVLYLDGDILCLGNISELYNITFPKGKMFPLAAVGKCQTESEIKRLRLTQSKVINAGVLLIDLYEWRRKKISEKLFGYANRLHEELIWLDNDVINTVLDGDFYLLDNKWNHRIYINKMHDLCILPTDIIIHYSGEYKPWTKGIENINEGVWWDYAKKSLWSDIKKT